MNLPVVLNEPHFDESCEPWALGADVDSQVGCLGVEVKAGLGSKLFRAEQTVGRTLGCSGHHFV